MGARNVLNRAPACFCTSAFLPLECGPECVNRPRSNGPFKCGAANHGRAAAVTEAERAARPSALIEKVQSNVPQCPFSGAARICIFEMHELRRATRKDLSPTRLVLLTYRVPCTTSCLPKEKSHSLQDAALARLAVSRRQMSILRGNQRSFSVDHNALTLLPPRSLSRPAQHLISHPRPFKSVADANLPPLILYIAEKLLTCAAVNNHVRRARPCTA